MKNFFFVQGLEVLYIYIYIIYFCTIRYDEVCNPGMSFDKPNNPNTRAFTQLVWNDSSFIGVGKATEKKKKDGDICTFIVVLYKPPGKILY